MIAEYPALGTPGWMAYRHLDDPPKWMRLYGHVVLEKLDPLVVWRELHQLAGGAEPVLLCWERLDGHKIAEFCHRTAVAGWLSAAVGEPIAELETGAPQQFLLAL